MKKEIKGYNLAIEELSKAKEKWYEEQVNQKEKIEMLRQQASDANGDINTTNHALEELRKITREPTIEGYYKPSEEMKEYQLISASAMRLGGGWVAMKIISMLS